MGVTITQTKIKQPCWRVIPSQYPAISIYERVAVPEDFEAVVALESMTNPRIRQEIGQIQLVPPEDRVTGNPGDGYIMAAFTHLNPAGGRFSNGSYGVYYAGEDLETAIAETVYHRENFMRQTDEAPATLVNRALIADIEATLDDIRGRQADFREVYSKDSYAHSQAFGSQQREQGSDGIVYDSVRAIDKICFAIFRPKALKNCRSERHLGYVWDGKSIRTVFQMDKFF